MPKVFISHSSHDWPFVEQEIIAPLKRHGVETWYSRDHIQATSDWEKSIRKGLSACDWFLVVLSPQSVESEWVRSELHWALEHRANYIIPVLIKTCNSTDLHLRLARVQHIDFRNDLQDAQKQLLKIWNIDYEYKRQPHELRLVQGPFDLQGAIYPLRGRVIVGRRPDQSSDPDCTVITLSDDCLARRHAEFVLKEDGYVHVTDLDSPNGTLVNGRCIRSAVLHDGDEIRLGRSLFVYRHFPKDSDQGGTMQSEGMANLPRHRIAALLRMLLNLTGHSWAARGARGR